MTHRNLSDLRSKNAEMEEQMIQLNKELHANQEIAKALEIDLKENVAQKNELKLVFLLEVNFATVDSHNEHNEEPEQDSRVLNQQYFP